MGLEEFDLNDDDGGGKSLISSNISCSICLEPVTDNGDRSWAKLQCGHEFHLDCIGSAFNIKGAMQCPNCRKIEKGQWLYATGSRSFSDIMDDWPHEDDYYEMFGVQWCPLPAFSQFPSFEEGDFPSTGYHDFLGQNVFAEHTAVSSSTHQCPYMAYYGPIHSSSSRSVGSVSDGSNYSNRWAVPSGPSEMSASYAIAAMDPHYHGWEQHSLNFPAVGSRLGASEAPSAPSLTPRSSRVNPDLPRLGSFVHPFVPSHSSGGRIGSPVSSSMIPPYPGSAARTRDRVQALQSYFQPPSTSPPLHSPMMSNTRRLNNHRASQGGLLPLSSDQTGSGFLVFPSGTSSQTFPEAENAPISSRFHGWERDYMTPFPLTQGDRDSSWLPHQVGGGSSSFCQLHGSERIPSQNW